MTAGHKNRNFGQRLGFAFNGLAQCLREEKSFRFQLLAAGGAALVLILLRPPVIWVALVVLVSAMVLSAELFNSALERLADELDTEANAGIKAAKDMAAAAVLLLACTAVLVALCLLYLIVTETS